MLAPKIVDLNGVVTENVKMLTRLIGEDIDLVMVPGPDIGAVKADPGQIEQVIMNLAVNARDAMPHGGKLTIETANVTLDANYARFHAPVKPGDYVMLAISDTGMGMDADTQAHIFEPFYTTKGLKGTGLGLSTVYGIVKQSEGYIWLYSEAGKGTSFKIYLPRFSATGEALATQPALARMDQPSPGHETILLVEDEENLRRLARQSLENQGYNVIDAPDGAAAIKISQAHKGPIHLLLTDVIMPGMNGRELANKVSPTRPEMRVLYMSGYTENHIGHNGTLDEGITLLQKPFTLPALKAKVREMLDTPLPQEIHMSARLAQSSSNGSHPKQNVLPLPRYPLRSSPAAEIPAGRRKWMARGNNRKHQPLGNALPGGRTNRSQRAARNQPRAAGGNRRTGRGRSSLPGRGRARGQDRSRNREPDSGRENPAIPLPARLPPVPGVSGGGNHIGEKASAARNVGAGVLARAGERSSPRGRETSVPISVLKRSLSFLQTRLITSQITSPNRNTHETITASLAPPGVSRAHFASGPPLFRTSAHQESRIHTDGSDLAGARHWSGHRCV